MSNQLEDGWDDDDDLNLDDGSDEDGDGGFGDANAVTNTNTNTNNTTNDINTNDGWGDDDDDDLNFDDDDEEEDEQPQNNAYHPHSHEPGPGNGNGVPGGHKEEDDDDDGWGDDDGLDLDFDDDPDPVTVQPPPPQPTNRTMFIPKSSGNNAFGAGFNFNNNNNNNNNKPVSKNGPSPPRPSPPPPPRAEQNDVGVSTSEEENGWDNDDDLDLDFDGDGDGGDQNIIINNNNNLTPGVFNKTAQNGSTGLEDGWGNNFNDHDNDLDLVVGDYLNDGHEQQQENYYGRRIAPETPEHEITFYTESNIDDDNNTNNNLNNESSDDGWGDDEDFFVDDDDEAEGMQVVGGGGSSNMQQQQQIAAEAGDTQQQMQPPVDVKLAEIQEQLESYVSSLDRIVWSINAVLEFEYSTPEKAQELVDYYSSRQHLAEYTRKKELPRMEYSVVLPFGHVETDKDEIRAQYLPDESILARCANQSLLADLLHQITGPDLIVRPAFLAVCVAHWCKFTIHLAGNLGGEDMVDCACRLHLSLPTAEGERMNLAEITVQILFKPSEPMVEYRVLSIDVLLKDKSQLESTAQFLNMIEGHFDEFPGHEDMQLHNAPADKYRDVFLENSQKLLTQSTMGMKSALQQMESVVNLRQKLNIVKGGYKTISKFIPDTDQLLAAEEEARNVAREREQQQQQQQHRNHMAPPPPPPPPKTHPQQPPPPPPPRRPLQMPAPPSGPNEATRPTSILGGFVSSGWNALAKSMAIPDEDPDIYGATVPSAQTDQQPPLYRTEPAATANDGLPPKVYHREEPTPPHQFPRPPKHIEEQSPTSSHGEESTPRHQFPRAPKPVEERPALDGVNRVAPNEQHSTTINNRQSSTPEPRHPEPRHQPPPPPPPPPKVDIAKAPEGNNSISVIPGPPPPAMDNSLGFFGLQDDEQHDAVTMPQREKAPKKAAPPPPPPPPPPMINADKPAAVAPLQRTPAPPAQTLLPADRTSVVAPPAPLEVGNGSDVRKVEPTNLKQAVTSKPSIDDKKLNQNIVTKPSTETIQPRGGVSSEETRSNSAESPLQDLADPKAREATIQVQRTPAIVDVEYNSDDDIIETCKRWRNPRPYRPYMAIS